MNDEAISLAILVHLIFPPALSHTVVGSSIFAEFTFPRKWQRLQDFAEHPDARLPTPTYPRVRQFSSVAITYTMQVLAMERCDPARLFNVRSLIGSVMVGSTISANDWRFDVTVGPNVDSTVSQVFREPANRWAGDFRPMIRRMSARQPFVWECMN